MLSTLTRPRSKFCHMFPIHTTSIHHNLETFQQFGGLQFEPEAQKLPCVKKPKSLQSTLKQLSTKTTLKLRYLNDTPGKTGSAILKGSACQYIFFNFDLDMGQLNNLTHCLKLAPHCYIAISIVPTSPHGLGYCIKVILAHTF